MSKILFIGIDAHSKSNTACFMNQNGDVLLRKYTFKNNLPEAELFEDEIVSILKSQQFDSFKIASESSSLYNIHLLDFLAASEKLFPFAPEIFQLNPKTTNGFKKAYPDKDKDDDIDAFVIADRLRFGRLPEPYISHQPYIPLRRLCRYRFHLVESLSREKNYFLLQLFLRYSSFSEIKPFSNIFGATSLELILNDFSLDEIAQQPVETLVNRIVKISKNRFKDPKQIAEKVKQVVRESYRLRPALANSINLILASTLQNIKTITKALKDVDKAISNEFQAFPNTLMSVPGLGPVYSAGIFAEIGNIDLFASHNALAKFAGLTWRKTGSADFKAEITRMTKTGNKYLRYYLIEAANLLRVHNKEYSDYYNSKFSEVTKHQHKRAVALTARKLVRLVFSLLKNNQLYQQKRKVVI